jgi:hypothetical protein
METARILKEMVRTRTLQPHVTRRTLLARAHRDSQATCRKFAAENNVAIGLVKDLYSVSIQHVLSLAFDVERQRYMERNAELEGYAAATIWYDTAENDPVTGWIMVDLEYEKDRREGRSHLWRRHRYEWNVEPITGEQMNLLGGVS